MGRKYTIDIVREAFADRGYTLLSDSYTRDDIKLEFICNKHADMGIQTIDFHHFIHRGQGCIYCSKERPNPKRISDDELKRLCVEKDFTFIDSFAENGQTKIHFICNKHSIKGVQVMDLGSLKKSKGCKYCAGKLRTTEDFKLLINQLHPNIEVVGEYTKAQNNIECRCKIHNYFWSPTANQLLNGQGCPVCGQIMSNEHSTKTNEEFIAELQIHNPNIYPLEKYKKAREKIWFKCKVCGHEWQATPDQMLRAKYGCALCAQKAITATQIKSNEDFLRELSEVNPSITPLEPYKTDHEKILCRCEIHNYEWYVSPNKLLHKRTGCPKCAMYHNEEIIAHILDEFQIAFKPYHRFADCKDKYTLPFDFYLIDYNICIEYDGEQHFQPINFNGDYEIAKKSFQITQLHDKIKTEYCLNNSIPLIRIPYWENKDIRGFLLQKLQEYIPIYIES